MKKHLFLSAAIMASLALFATACVEDEASSPNGLAQASTPAQETQPAAATSTEPEAPSPEQMEALAAGGTPQTYDESVVAARAALETRRLEFEAEALDEAWASAREQLLLDTFNQTNERHVAPNPLAELKRLECRQQQCYLHLDYPSEACQRAFEGLFILAVARLEANQGSLTTLPADDHIELHIFFTFPRQ